MKKFLAALMACLMLLAVLCACGEELPPEAEGSDSAEATEPEATEPTPAPVLPLDLVKDGQTVFVITYPENASENLIGAALALRLALQDKTGVILKVSDDFLREGETPDPNAFEILIGETNRQESTKVLSSLVGYNDYAVEICGNKLVMTGKQEEGTTNAVYYYINRILGKLENVTMGTKDLSFTEEQNYLYKAVYPLASMTLLGAPIGEYNIVIPADAGMTEKRFAAQLSVFINTMTGAELPLITDAESRGTKEIYVGKTSKTTETVSRYEYKITAKGGNLELLADSLFGFEQMQSDLRTLLSIGTVKDAAKADAGVVKTADVSANIPTVTQKNGELRIMYHNVWGWNESATNPTEQRNEMMINVYAEYNADILCLQEVTHQMRLNKDVPLLKGMEKYGYAEVEFEPIKNLYTATPILYKTDKVKVIDKGLIKFDFGGGQDKFITWAVFETLEGGKKLGVISVHLAYQGGEQGEAYRLAQVPQVVEVAKQINTKYFCPVLTGGDMNCNMNSKPYAEYLKLGFTDVWTAIGEGENRDDDATNFGYPTWNSQLGMFERPGGMGGSFATAIDHVFYYGMGLSFKSYRIIQDNYVMCTSDHCPAVIDFDLETVNEQTYTDSEYTKNY